MKSFIGDILKAALTEEKKTEVGKVDIAFAMDLLDLQVAHERSHDDIKVKVEEFIKALQKEHEPVCKKMAEKEKGIWEDIYDELLIPEDQRDKKYAIDKTTGIVARIDTELNPIFKDAEDPIVH